jgi:hypothetical protein
MIGPERGCERSERRRRVACRRAVFRCAEPRGAAAEAGSAPARRSAARFGRFVTVAGQDGQLPALEATAAAETPRPLLGRAGFELRRVLLGPPLNAQRDRARADAHAGRAARALRRRAIAVSVASGLAAPMVNYISSLHRQRSDLTLTVIMPEIVVRHWWHRVLHNRIASRLRRALRPLPKIVVTTVPFHLPS